MNKEFITGQKAWSCREGEVEVDVCSGTDRVECREITWVVES